MSLHVTPSEGISQICMAFCILRHMPHCFSQPDIFVAASLQCSPKGWVAPCGAQTPHPSGREFCTYDITPLLWVTVPLEGFLVRPCLCLCYPSLCDAFIPCCWQSFSAGFHFSRNYSICSCRFGVSLGGGKFRVFLCQLGLSLHTVSPSVMQTCKVLKTKTDIIGYR